MVRVKKGGSLHRAESRRRILEIGWLLCSVYEVLFWFFSFEFLVFSFELVDSVWLIHFC